MMARGLKFWVQVVEVLYYLYSENKTLNQVNISTAMTSSKELLLRNPTKTATFNGHAKSSLIKNATSWDDTDSCCVADVGVS